jgi:tagatose-1,6-bisphosphate aldolase non-catalytic subunit AgaZ/GatZ
VGLEATRAWITEVVFEDPTEQIYAFENDEKASEAIRNAIKRAEKASYIKRTGYARNRKNSPVYVLGPNAPVPGNEEEELLGEIVESYRETLNEMAFHLNEYSRHQRIADEHRAQAAEWQYGR